jgi:hypothetical protein
MEQEAAQELIDSQCHEPFLVAMRGIAPAEGDVAIKEGDQPGVGDGDAMRVSDPGPFSVPILPLLQS